MLKKQERKELLKRIFVLLRNSECVQAKAAKALVLEMLAHDGLFIFDNKE